MYTNLYATTTIGHRTRSLVQGLEQLFGLSVRGDSCLVGFVFSKGLYLDN